MQEEIDNPNKSFKQVLKEVNIQEGFQGMHQCKLCPKIILRSDTDLNDHLNGQRHKKAMQKYYKEHDAELKHKMRKAKSIVKRRILFRTRGY
jgi:hypothetical protein